MTGALDPAPELIASFDETQIAVRILGPGSRGTGATAGSAPAVPLLAVSPIGVTLSPWRKVVVDVVRERPVVTWDHRGMHDSGPPRSPRIDAPAHAEDAMAALDHHEIDDFAVISWSNGSRIAIEIAAQYAERVRALVLVSGGYGHPANRILRFEIASVAPVLASVAKYFSGALERSFRGLVRRPELAGLIRQSGMVGATADTTALVALLRDMAACDLEVLLATFAEVVGDSASSLLGQVQAPTLVVVGDRDQFTSTAMIAELERAIPDCTVIRYEGATHYLPLELPARLSDDLRSFLKQAGV